MTSARSLLARAPFKSAALALALGGAFAPAPAAAQDFTRSVMNAIGLGGRSDVDDIEYRQRAPLVVPPRLDHLPPPRDTVGVGTEAWPNDPDVARRRGQAAEARRPVRTDFRENDRLPASELQRRSPGRGGSSAYQASNQGDLPRDELIGPIVQGREMARQRDRAVALEEAPGAEPARRSLTDPPSGLRRQTQVVARQRGEPTIKPEDESQVGDYARTGRTR